MFENIYMNVLVYATPVLVILGGWIAVKVKALLDAKITNTTLNGVLSRLASTVETAVSSVYQQFVEPIKAGGTLTDDQKAQAKAMALAEIKSHLGTKGLQELEYILGWSSEQVQSNLGSHVESAVAKLNTPAK